MRFNALVARQIWCSAFAAVMGVTVEAQPSIVIAPQAQTNDYGTDITFSVSANGTAPLSYQWLKNGGQISDYEEIAGAQSSTLHIIGAAYQDEGTYQVIVSDAGGSVTSAPVTLTVKPTIVFEDGFEAGLGEWQPLIRMQSLSLNYDHNHTTDGGISAEITNTSQSMFHNLGEKLSGRARFSAWIYDRGSNEMALLTAKGFEGPGYTRYLTRKALLQTLAIGIYSPAYDASFANGTTSNPATYRGWIFRGTNRGWFNLDAPGAPTRSPGWHHFTIDRWNTNGMVDFYVDDVLAKRVYGAQFEKLDTVIIGASGVGPLATPVPTSALFDDVRVENFPQTFDWSQYSSGNSPFPDWMIYREVGGNPASTNVSQIRTVSEVEGGSASRSEGAWVTNTPDIYAADVRGRLEYTVTAPANDIYRIEVEGRERNYLWPPVELPLHLWIDGEYLGQFNLSYGATSNGFVHCFSPYVLAGSHTIDVLWDNAHPRQSLNIRAVRLQAINGSSIAGGGMKTWVANRLAAECGVEAGVAESITSPACVEGRGQFLSMMSLSAGTPLAPVTINHGAGYRWYANVPLSTNQPTPIVVSYQNGGWIETNSITWQPIDLLQGGSFTIRQGDSVLFTAVPSGATNGIVSIAISDGTTLSANLPSPVPHQFTQAGTFTITGIFGSTTGVVNITVVGASLEPSVPVNGSRPDWVCTNVSSPIFLDADPRLTLSSLSAADESGLKPPLQSLETNEQAYLINNAAFEPRYILARAGQNGPVLASTVVQGCHCFVAPDSRLRFVSSQQDGSQVIEGTYVLSPVPTNVTLKINVLTAGLTFEDGSVSRVLEPADFDKLGVYKAKFIRAADLEGSVCIQAQVQYNDSRRIQQ